MTDIISLTETRLQLALDAGAMGTWTSDISTGAQTWDRRQFELFGLSPDIAPTRELFLSLVVPEDRPGVEWNPNDLKPGARHISQFRIRRADGQIRWLAASSLVRTGAGGVPLELVGVNWDITEDKEAEAGLVQAEHRLSLATQAAAIGIWDWNVETGEFFYSELARRIYGFSPTEDITFEKLRDRTHPEDFKKVEPALGRALDPTHRSHETYRYRITRADNGEERWLLAHGGAVFSRPGPDGRALRYTGTLQDITEEVRLEENLHDERAKLELAISAGGLALWELDPKTGVITHSPTLNRLFGFPDDARPSYADFSSRYAPGETDRLQAEAAEAMARGESSIRVEAKQLWPDGTTKWIAVRARIFTGDDGTPDRVIGVALDETERRQWEQTLLTTAAELQHRVKNTLAIVQSLARQTFGAKSAADEEVSTFFGRLRSLAAATDLITRNNWGSVPLRELLTEVVSPFGTAHRFVLTGGPASIESRDATDLSMCIHELCTNATKYGALSTNEGRVLIDWQVDRERLVLNWREQGGPPVRPPVRSGFGSKLLRSRGFGKDDVELRFDPGGLHAVLTLRAAALSLAKEA